MTHLAMSGLTAGSPALPKDAAPRPSFGCCVEFSSRGVSLPPRENASELYGHRYRGGAAAFDRALRRGGDVPRRGRWLRRGRGGPTGPADGARRQDRPDAHHEVLQDGTEG